MFTTIQFIDSLALIKKQLEKNNIKVKLFKTKHTKYKGQLLGCNIEKFSGIDAFLYLGDGLFHPKALILKNNIPVYVYNPINKGYTRLIEWTISRVIHKICLETLVVTGFYPS